MGCAWNCYACEVTRLIYLRERCSIRCAVTYRCWQETLSASASMLGVLVDDDASLNGRRRLTAAAVGDLAASRLPSTNLTQAGLIWVVYVV
jgi:hypothetical protein